VRYCQSTYNRAPTKRKNKGAASQSIVVVTAYDSLGEQGLQHSINETESTATFIDSQLMPSLMRVLSHARSLRHIIYNKTATKLDTETLKQIQSDFPHIMAIGFDELRRSGAECPTEPTPPGKDDLCCIMYTSGSMGPPKGVCLTHGMIVAAGNLSCFSSFFGFCLP
jgi:long-chain acyl-CoA synthetase